MLHDMIMGAFYFILAFIFIWLCVRISILFNDIDTLQENQRKYDDYIKKLWGRLKALEVPFVAKYTEALPNYGDLMTVQDFRDDCEAGNFIDYDGYGHPVKNNLQDTSIHICPSRQHQIPIDATHIMWFNR